MSVTAQVEERYADDISQPSLVNVGVAGGDIPAFKSAMSNRPPSFSNRSPKALTEARLDRSTIQTSAVLQPVASSISGKSVVGQ